MWFAQRVSSDLYQRALDQFMIDAKFYFGAVQRYVLDLTLEERLLGLCALILFLIYVIVMRARRKYNPGSLGRQFATAVLVLGVVMIGGNIIFGTGAGAFSDVFEI